MTIEITPPAFESVDIESLTAEKVESANIPGYDLWYIANGTPLSESLTRALRVMHIRDFTLRALMPDSSHKFANTDEAASFTTGKMYKRDAYVLTAQADESLETNLAAFGWFRPIIDPRTEGNYEDYDLAAVLYDRNEDLNSHVTAAIEVFAGYRNKLATVDLIDTTLADYNNRHPELHGVCVRVGTPRAINMVEHTQFDRLTTEEGGGGIFVRQL